MTGKGFEKIDEEEYGAYWIIDISNCVKTKEDFLEDDIYDIYAWEEYLKECGNVLNSKNVVKLLNELHEENEKLKKQREELFIRERDTKNRWRELKQENESLKEENKFLQNKVKTYKKGNALLKSTMDKEWK